MQLADQMWEDLRQACTGAWLRRSLPDGGYQFKLQGVATVNVYYNGDVSIQDDTQRYCTPDEAVEFVMRLCERTT